MIFRKAALERLSSPEQLDQLLQVTDPRGWIALVSLALVIVGAGFWGIFSSIPTTTTGQGILLRRGGIVDVEAHGAGQIDQILVSVGQRVKKGELIARIRQEGLLRQRQDAEAKRADLEEQYRSLERNAAVETRLTEENLAQERANLERTIETLAHERELLEERAGAEEKLLTDGLITKQTLLDTRQKLNTTRDEIAAKKLELAHLDLKRVQSRQQLSQQLETRKNELRDLELQIRDFEARLAEDVEVISPYEGRVLELTANPGDVVAAGSSVLSLELLSEDLIAVLFVPASAGKKVQVGMAAQVSPSTVKREEFGYLLGQVAWVAAFPSTSKGMVRLLGNQDLVSGLMKEGPPLEVHVALVPDTTSPTGYRWSSSRGPDLEISSGTLMAGSVIVRRDRPLALLLPKVRERLGL